MLGPAVRSTQEIETKAMLWALNGSGQVLVGIRLLGLLADPTQREERDRAYAAQFALTHLF
jgi:MFS transporter, NRE family, putaive nickel resistance protein